MQWMEQLEEVSDSIKKEMLALKENSHSITIQQASRIRAMQKAYDFIERALIEIDKMKPDEEIT